MKVFDDRLDAGRELARRLEQYRGSDAVIVGLARGGVEVGFGLAQELRLPLRALVIRKIGAPFNPEFAIGAVSETGAVQLDLETIDQLRVPSSYLRAEIDRELGVARERQERYAVGPRLAETVRGKSVIVVDDGIATGASAVVAVESVRALHAGAVILAAPVASPRAVADLQHHVDELVVLEVPLQFYAVGQYYRSFGQVDDDTVVYYLRQAQTIADGHREPVYQGG